MATLAVWADLSVPTVLRAVPDATVAPAGRDVVEDVLYDAPDLRLLRSGIQLRRSSEDTWHVWVMPSPWWHRDCGSEVVLHTEPVVGGAPPEVLVGALRGAAPSAALTVRVRRRSWHVATGTVTEVAADEAVAAEEADPPATDPASADPPAGGEAPVSRATVVLEDLALLTGRRVGARRALVHVDGDRDLVGQLVARFEAAGAEELVGEVPPVLDLLGGRVRRPVVPAEPAARLPADATAGHVVGLAIARAVARLLANDVAIRLDLGPEAVHQARVATRRLRSDLKTFSGLLEPMWTATTSEDLRWVAAALGAVRDADVLTERLEGRIDALEADDRATAGWLLDELHAQRDVAVAELAQVMAGDRYLRLLDSLVAAANHPTLTADAEVDAAATFEAMARDAWRPLRKAARKVTTAADPLAVPVEQIHAVRIRAKRFRYATDAAAPVERAAARHARALAALQEELGELNDAAVAEDWLRSRLADADTARSFVLGQLVAAERAEIAARRRTWLGPWRRVNRRTRRAWLTP